MSFFIFYSFFFFFFVKTEFKKHNVKKQNLSKQKRKIIDMCPKMRRWNEKWSITKIGMKIFYYLKILRENVLF